MTIDLVKRINKSIGLRLSVEKTLRTRKGFAYKVAENEKEMLLKMIELKLGDGDTVTRIRSLQKEARILRDLSEFTGNLYINSGEVDDHFWLLRNWLHGKTASQHISYLKTKPVSLNNKRRFVRDLIGMLKKVIELYDLDYLHGDLQPGHFIMDSNGDIRLIDLELAVNVNDPDATYRGALVHYVSPETASEMLIESKNIPLDPISELYSFGAVAFYLYTGVVPVAYGESMEDHNYEFPFERQLFPVSEGRVRSFQQARADPFPLLEQILMTCLATDRSQRYQTFEELLFALEKVEIKKMSYL